MSVLLGAIADDFTGATDLANSLVRKGLQTLLTIGVPENTVNLDGAEAVVIALKTRTAPVQQATASSIRALRWLRQLGVRQLFFKYCSTFDSTDAGNIGPVANALLNELGETFTIVCPAYPANGRTVYKGHLFVGEKLLSNSGMKNHPLTPMRDANLVDILSRQLPADPSRRVGLVDQSVVAQGADTIHGALETLRAANCRYAIIDAINETDLLNIGEAVCDLRLITGGSGVALALPKNYRQQGLIAKSMPAEPSMTEGRRAVLVGSCSQATRAQVAFARQHWPVFDLEPQLLLSGSDLVGKALRWTETKDRTCPILITSSANPELVQRLQNKAGQLAVGGLIEQAFAGIAIGLVEQGFSQLVIAGGETSGAVVSALGIAGLRIGREISPGVPWCQTLGPTTLALALKSGNFGGKDFFHKAFEVLK